jgi:hypothetical protein
MRLPGPLAFLFGRPGKDAIVFAQFHAIRFQRNDRFGAGLAQQRQQPLLRVVGSIGEQRLGVAQQFG